VEPEKSWKFKKENLDCSLFHTLDHIQNEKEKEFPRLFLSFILAFGERK
jgi:hypothetical protein